MMFKMPIYEVRCHGKEEWEDITEIDLMQRLNESYDRVTPAIRQMIEGEKVMTQYALYRLKVKKVRQMVR